MKIEAVIKFEQDKITLKGTQKGYSVYNDNYENDYDYIFKNVDELISFLNSEI